jgi:hypothetical protein
LRGDHAQIKGIVRDDDSKNVIPLDRRLASIFAMGIRLVAGELAAGRADTRRNHTSLDSVGTSR